MRFALGLSLGIICAVVLHAGFILFGGILFLQPQKNAGTLQEVELLDDNVDKKKDEPPPEKIEKIETDQEQAPDAAEIIRNLEQPVVDNTPKLDAASLSAIEAALSGAGGGGDFAQALDFASGGRIGGTGKAGTLDEKTDEAFGLAEMDQRPRVVFQVAPLYPAELRSKKLEGVVSILFIVDASGKVSNPHVEKSTDPAFEKPALDALKRWKFEPGVKGGERVPCKMRVGIRFQPAS